MKLYKFIASTGHCSRRQAQDLISEKRVKVNGVVATIYNTVETKDTIKVDDVVISKKIASSVYIAYNKPKGIICTSEKIERNIIDAVNHPEKIYPVGRLDKESEGLILLTNKSELIDLIANPKGNHEKQYLVTLNLPVRQKFLDEISKGIQLGDEKTKPCKAMMEKGTKRVFRIILSQGLNRQIRKMCNAYNYQVVKLQRVRVMHIQLNDLRLGEWRDLTKEEIDPLLSLIPNKVEKVQSSKFKVGNVQSSKFKVEKVRGSKVQGLKVQGFKVQGSKVQGSMLEDVVNDNEKISTRKKKHEIIAAKKDPWKKMHQHQAKRSEKPKISTNPAKPHRKKKDNRGIKKSEGD